MRKFLFMIITLLVSGNIYAQLDKHKGYNLSITLNNAPFTSLALRDYRNLQSLIIKGEHVERFKWKFNIPDSIGSKSEFMELIIPEKDTAMNGYRQVRFRMKYGDKELTISNVGLQEKHNFIEGIFLQSKFIENENVAYILGITDSVILGTLVLDDFQLIIKDENSDIAVRSKDPYFGWFDKGDNNLSYKDNLAFYAELAKNHPDSKYLMSYLSMNLNRFETTADVKKIYDKLSGRFKDTKWGRRIEQYLNNESRIPTFINLDTNKPEPLVLDSSKYNLLIFSASWCGPCIEEMPLLQKLHQQLKERINFTTVSMDYESKVKAFQDLLKRNQIDWRTLYAFKDLDLAIDKFAIRGIPLTILIYPTGEIERMDIRDTDIQRKLHSLKL